MIFAVPAGTLGEDAGQPLKATAAKDTPKELTVDLGSGVKLELILVAP
jgi:hypothetical protein